MIMQGLTIQEIAERLGISTVAVYTRLRTTGIQPKDHAGKTNIYDESVVDLIREVSKGGRPRKAQGEGDT
jgi:transposase